MNIAIILAGGIGSRINSNIPKQFVNLSGQMMIMRSMGSVHMWTVTALKARLWHLLTTWAMPSYDSLPGQRNLLQVRRHASSQATC